MVSTSSRKRKASQPQANSLGRFGIQRAFAAGTDGTAGQSVDEVVVPTGTASQGDLLEAASVPQLAADTQGVSPQVEAKVEALAEVAMAESPAEAVMVEAPAEVNDAEPELTPMPAGQKRQEADAPRVSAARRPGSLAAKGHSIRRRRCRPHAVPIDGLPLVPLHPSPPRKMPLSHRLTAQLTRTEPTRTGRALANTSVRVVIVVSCVCLPQVHPQGKLARSPLLLQRATPTMQ